MRYIADESGWLKVISFGAMISCGGQDCKAYTGTVPSGYDSLHDWYAQECDNLYRWKVNSIGELERRNVSAPAKEWVNPPMIPGEEYLTTERFNKNPVYTKVIVVNNASGIGMHGPNDSTTDTREAKVIRQNAVFHGSNIQRVLSVSEAHVFSHGSENLGYEYNLPSGYSGAIYFQAWYIYE